MDQEWWRDKAALKHTLDSCRTVAAVSRAHSRLLPLCPHRVYLSNLLLHAYARCGALHHARRLFDSMPTKNFFSWALMLAAYAQTGHHLFQARQVFHAMPEHDVASVTTLAAAYARHGHLRVARAIFDAMPAWDTVSWNFLLSAYFARGRTSEALELFDRIRYKNLASWNTLLAAYAQAGHVEIAMRVFVSMPLWDLVSCTTILELLLQKSEIDLLGDGVLGLMPEWDTVARNAVISSLAQRGRLERATEVVATMEETNLVTLNIVLSAFLHALDFDGALHFFVNEMPEHNLFSWNTLLAAYAQHGDVAKASQVFDAMGERDVVSWNSLLHGFSQSGRVEDAKRIFDVMPERSIASWTSLLVVYAQNGYIDYARTIFSSIYELDLVSWTAMLVAYALHGKLFETKLLFFQMPEWNQVSWNALLSAHTHRGSQLAAARKLFDSMPSQDLMSWSTMLGAYSQSGNTNTVLDFFHSMMATTAEYPDECCFIRLLHACNHGGGLYSGRSCFTSISFDYGVRPTKQHFCCMVDILGRAGRLGDAEDLIHTMPFRADALEWTCLLAACQSYGDQQRAARAVEWIVRARPENSGTYVLLANDKCLSLY